MQLHTLSETHLVLDFPRGAGAEFAALLRRLVEEFGFVREDVAGSATEEFRLRLDEIVLEGRSSPLRGHALSARCHPATDLLKFIAATATVH